MEATFTYGTYGELLSGSTGLTRFLYNGRCGVTTDENGLYYMRQRYYSPELKRFVNQDVIAGSLSNSQSLNRYSYVQGNPVSYTDSFGLSPLNGLFTGTTLWHGVLGLLGCIPGPVGAVANLIDGAIYLTEGDYFGAAVCFVAGTKVKTADGDRNIEDIAVGDEVYSCDVETGETGLKHVLRIKVSEATDLTHVTIDGETIDATPTHPFYVVGYGFKPAEKLLAGEKVLLLNGETKEVENVTTEHLEEPVKVYNFEVEDWHTYYVTEQGVLVHNDYGAGANKGGSNIWTSDKGIYSVAYEIELPSDMYPGVSDARYFQEANRQLHEAFVKNPEFAQAMETLYPGIIDGVAPGLRGAYPRTAPTPAVIWHHDPYRVGILQLVPTGQHTASGLIQSVLHPNGRGGMQNWGGGRK